MNEFEVRNVLAIGADGNVGMKSVDLRSDKQVPGYDGYFCTWNTVDHHGTFFTKGAFAASIKTRAETAPVLWQHQPDMPIGKHLSITEDGRGVFARTRLIEGVAAADEALALLRGGVALGLSFGFRTKSDRAATDADTLDFSVAPEWAREAPRREIKAITQVDFWESSTVTFASNEKATPTAIRQGEIRGLLEAIARDKLGYREEMQLAELVKHARRRGMLGHSDPRVTRRANPDRQALIEYWQREGRRLLQGR